MVLILAVTISFLATEFESVSGLRCFSCSSNNDQQCVWTISDTANIVNCDAGCINAILPDGSLFRGCSSDLPKAYLKQEPCAKDLCNDNVFPQSRLACYHCAGPECVNVDKSLKAASQLCRNFVENDTCFTGVKSPVHVFRGCTSDSNPLSDLSIKKCDRPYCNDEPAVKQLLCWECDSRIDDEVACKKGKKNEGIMGKCQMNLLLGQEGFCYVWHHEEHVRRGCSNDKFLKNLDKYTKACKESLCNDQRTSIEQCYSCNSETDNNCRITNAATPATICSDETSSCFACKDFGNIVRRGCSQPDQCIGACFPCWNGTLCNSNNMFECYSCDSSSDPLCELLPFPDLVDQEICNKGCEVKLKDEILYRSCIGEDFECSEENFCSRCYQDQCNNFYIDSECGVVKYAHEEFYSNEEVQDVEKL